MNRVRLRATGTPEVMATSDGRLSVSVPILIKRHGGRKLVARPGTATKQPQPAPLQLALARS